MQLNFLSQISLQFHRLLQSRRISKPYSRATKLVEELGQANKFYIINSHSLSIVIHIRVVSEVVAAGDVIQPFLMFKIPLDSLRNAFLKL
mgnify:CR=1 FL=1